MKKFNKFGYASAMLLATAMGFTGCSSDDEMENINPTFDGNSVKTQFAISLTKKANKGGRMATEEALPGDGSNVATFYGLTGMRLYQFEDASINENAIFEKEQIFKVDETEFVTETGFDNDLNALIYDITIPVGVKNFLFYGENAAVGATEKQAKIDATWAGAGQTVGTTKFAPSTILSDYTVKEWSDAVANIETILNTLHGYLTADAVMEYLKVETAALEALNTASSEHILALMNRIYNSIGEQIAAIDNSTLKTAIQGVQKSMTDNYFDYDDENKTLAWKKSVNPHFPTKFNLPAGAVAVDYTTKDSKLAFHVLEVSTITHQDAVDAAIADYTKFAYPPTLMYFANSPARTSNIPYLKETTKTNWSEFVAQYAQNVVTSTTQSVVLENQVNFGMAQLKTKVNFAAGVIIKDNAENAVDVTTNPFTVTGVLVGNQQGVEWDFTHDESSAVYTVYDKVMTSEMTTSNNVYNYTTVFESRPATDATDSKGDVLVAVELVNKSGKDFVGVGGQIVAAGAKFYLVGKLVVKDGKLGDVTHDYTKLQQVFKQDYVTTANLTISSLKNAYNVIPDLETPEMEFGLSVDLSWQTGLTFNVTIQ